MAAAKLELDMGEVEGATVVVAAGVLSFLFMDFWALVAPPPGLTHPVVSLDALGPATVVEPHLETGVHAGSVRAVASRSSPWLKMSWVGIVCLC